jgi:hypothetical protein
LAQVSVKENFQVRALSESRYDDLVGRAEYGRRTGDGASLAVIENGRIVFKDSALVILTDNLLHQIYLGL